MSDQYNQGPRQTRVQRNNRINEQPTKINSTGKSHTLLKTLSLLLVMLVFLAGAYGFRLLSQTQNAMNNSYAPLPDRNKSYKILQHKPISILLLGADTGGLGRSDQGNSDSMIIVTVNPDTKKTQLISVPRDTLTEIKVPASNDLLDVSNNGLVLQKINSAYNMGGESLAISTLEDQLNIPIDYYVRVDFSSLQKIVDGVGGIDVDVPFSFMDPESGGHQFTKGPMHLNGAQALDYSRMRHKDPQGDYGRQKRQRQVITAILKKTVSVGSLTHYQDILNSVSDSMRTDLTFNDLAILASTYRSSTKKLKSDYIHGHGTTIPYSNFPYGLSVEVPSTKEYRRVSNEIRNNLNLPSETLKNEVIRQNRLNENNGFNFDLPDNQNYYLFNKYYDERISQPYI